MEDYAVVTGWNLRLKSRSWFLHFVSNQLIRCILPQAKLNLTCHTLSHVAVTLATQEEWRNSHWVHSFWLESSLCWWSPVLSCKAFLCRDCSLDGDSCFSRKDHTCTTWIQSTRSWKERSPGLWSCVPKPRTLKPSLSTQYVTVEFWCLFRNFSLTCKFKVCCIYTFHLCLAAQPNLLFDGP